MSEAMRAAAELYNNPRYNSPSEIRIRKNKLRRKKIFRTQIALLTAAIAVMLFTLVFMASSLMTSAQSDEYQPSFKYYKSVTVHSDDSIWSIASQNYDSDHYKNMDAYINEICSINSITDCGKLNAGESLIIPYYSAEYK